MTYDAVRNGLVSIIAGQGLAESLEDVDFADAPSVQYGNTFILKAVSGEMGENSETLSTRFYDDQDWEIIAAFDRGAVGRDEMNRKRVDLLTALDNPTNWSSYVRYQSYRSWEIQEEINYFILRIRLKISDIVSY